MSTKPQVTISLNDPSILPADVAVIAGPPPVDQTALVAQLQSQLTTMTTDRDKQAADLTTMTGDRDQRVIELGNVKALASQLDVSDAAQDNVRAQIHAITG